MLATIKQTISLISVPFDLGAGKRGVTQGPNALLREGLKDALQRLDVEIGHDHALPEIPFAGEQAHPHLKHYKEVLEVNRLLAQSVSDLVETNQFPLVLGGDHSIAIGTIAGLTQRYQNMGVIWVDAHGDLNTQDTSPSGNIHGMSLAASLGLGDGELVNLGGRAPKIRPEHVVLIGARDLDQGERSLIRELGITCFTMHDIDNLGISNVMKQAIEIASRGTDGVHLSFDIDSVDPQEAPGTGTPVKGGLNYREAHMIMELLHQSGVLTSAELVEVNPTIDDPDQKTTKLAIELLESLFGKRIL
ncbi:arginase [Ammoniphilus sp. YIM 78166]|uniref:arginase n=1 Tax=Ammoniphilus sp. YIM 78166 TaxID=1644106 RepID=UPI00106F6A53|nr:arginase [Ammoniphilus sp. YIM 78166]